MTNRLTEARYIAFDTETTGLSPYHKDRIIGLSFGIPNRDTTVDTWYVPFRHERGHLANFPTKELARFRPIFADPEKTWVGWNAKFDCHFLHADSIEIEGTVLDAMLAWHLADENLMDYSLKGLSARILGKDEVMPDKDLQVVLKSERLNKGDMAQLSPLEAALYAESDAELTWRMFRKVIPKLKEDGLSGLFYEVCEYARVLERAERKGIRIDPVLADSLIDEAQTRDIELLAELRELAGENFNPGSYKQCQKWLGLSSTAKEFLEEVEDVPGVSQLLEYRGHSKALSSFYLPFRSRRDRFNRVHANFCVHGTVTRRLSCREPNLQNLPRTSSQWAKVRHMVQAAPGHKLISSDLSQAEFRLLAHYTGDSRIIQAYREGADMHTLVGNLLGIDRQSAKTFNFSLLYGGGVPTIKRQLRCTEEEATEHLEQFHRMFPAVKRLFYSLKKEADRWGYVALWTGARRRFPYVNGERMGTQRALNAVIQGGVAEIIRHAMCQLDKTLPEGAWQIVQIHDDILIECKNKLVKEVARLVKDTLESVHEFDVAIEVDQKWGQTWGSLQKL